MNEEYSEAQLNLFSDALGSTSIANVIRNRLLQIDPEKIDIPNQMKWFMSVIKRYQICDEDSVVEFSILLASNILSIDKNNDPLFTINLQKILGNRTLLKASRFFILGISKRIDPFKNYSLLIPAGW